MTIVPLSRSLWLPERVLQSSILCVQFLSTCFPHTTFAHCLRPLARLSLLSVFCRIFVTPWMILADFYRYMSVYIYIYLAHPPVCGAIVWKPVALRVPSISEHPSIHLSVYSVTTSPDPPLLAHVVSLVLSLQLFAFSSIRGQDSDSVSASVLSFWCPLLDRTSNGQGQSILFSCGMQVVGCRFSLFWLPVERHATNGSSKEKFPRNAPFFWGETVIPNIS